MLAQLALPARRRSTRLVGAALAMGGLAVATVALPDAPLTSRAHAATNRTVGPGADLTAELERLRPGDTLLLAPGTYSTGSGPLSPDPSTSALPPGRKMALGTATARITVRAADPRNRPLIVGEIKLWGPSYWTLDGLRVQAVHAGKDALYIGGGRDWIVRNSEFSGANRTGAYSNVTFANDIYSNAVPSRFAFTGNCVHDAGQTSRQNTDHNIYVSYIGRAGSGGVISRNIIFNHTNGAGIKLGNGGAVGAPGPWGVNVSYNTIAQGGRQVLLHGDVRNNSVTRNLFYRATEPFSTVNKTTSVYLNLVNGSGNYFANNYAASSTMFSWGKTARLVTDNLVRSNPGFSSAGCSGYRPTNTSAAPYGRYAVLR